jgi:XTP/dITP diphosphohydrolase
VDELVLATTNPGKIREFKSIFFLYWPSIRLRNLGDFNNVVYVHENGATFQENAELKATAYAIQLGIPCLADDSGLSVDILRGAPGIYSARYAGGSATNNENMHKLLEELKAVPDDERSARFVCCIAIAAPSNMLVSVTGELMGQIARAPHGTNGFGYDPIFYVPTYQKTLAELSPSEKDRISHRAIALRRAIESLRA